MATVIRPEVSKKNRYWISKHRHYELKHFCLQYPTWKKALLNTYNLTSSSIVEKTPSKNLPSDPVGNLVVMRVYYENRVKMIERIAEESDKYLASYIIKAVTEGLSYTTLRYKMGIPCSRDTYYDRYRKFFWLLSKNKRHNFLSHQELYWTAYSLCFPTFCHFLGNFIISSSQSFLSFWTKKSSQWFCYSLLRY